MSSQSINLGYGFGEQDTDNSIVSMALKRANRHGLIAGATGTGKTVSLQALAESFSQQGVPVFLCDVKGDVSGISQAGKTHPKLVERFEAMHLPVDAWAACPTVFWDVYGEQGHPVRTTLQNLGPLLLARLMELNETQEGILDICFALAEDQSMPLIGLDDLRALLLYVGENAKSLRQQYGNVTSQSVGAIQRRLLKLERSGAAKFFGEPMLDYKDLIKLDDQGQGMVNILAADELSQEPDVYGAVLLWLLDTLFEHLPEIGDPEKPVLVLFLDEAHLIFDNATDVLREKIEQTVRLIRSKGVGVYFVTQSPSDIPDEVLGQLANRLQHALRAFTPKEQKALRVAASTFRSDGSFDVEEAISVLGIGEALVSTLDDNGAPTPVRKTKVKPPVSRIGAATPSERQSTMGASVFGSKYDQNVDRESASEMLAEKSEEAAAKAESEQRTQVEAKPRKSGRKSSSRQGVFETFFKSMARALGGRAGRQILRSLMDMIFKRR